MARSLRWRLQFWYAVVLTAVVGGFAIILFLEVRAARSREIDADLSAAANYIDSSLRSWPRFELDGSAPRGEQAPPPRDYPPKGERDFPPKEREPPPPKGDRPPKGNPPSREKLIADLTPSGWPQAADEGERAYGIWRKDSAPIRVVNMPEQLPGEVQLGRDGDNSIISQGDDHVVARTGPRETVIVVRRSVVRLRAEMRSFAGRLFFIGAAVLGIGLLGGWWSSSRIVRPIRHMANTASQISASNLSQRIEPRELDAELAELAVVLNGTFKRLETAFAQLNRFTADASHELRTPLAVIRSHVELALSRPRTADEYRRTLDTCLRSTARMTAIVDGLLTLARADAGRLELPREPVDLSALASEVVTLLKPLASERGVTLIVDITPAVVGGDPMALARVVSNLIENAIRYNRPAGKVLVRLVISGGQAVLSIKDTGIGIPPTDRPHIFDRFYRVDQARSRESGGAGLGLAICKTIAEVHGGDIHYRARTHEGSEFRVTLPLSNGRTSTCDLPALEASNSPVT